MKVRLLFSDSACYSVQTHKRRGGKNTILWIYIKFKTFDFVIVVNLHQKMFSHRFLESGREGERETDRNIDRRETY